MDMRSASRSEPPRFRTVFISDLHLGARHAQAEALVRFLRTLDCAKLYLVGDIIDIWAVRRTRYWHWSHSEAIHSILTMAQEGTQVVYIPGNHDEIFRDFCNRELGNASILRDHMHETADGRTYLVIHGDKFDGVVFRSAWVGELGRRAYAAAFFVSNSLNRLRRTLGWSYWSLAAFVGQKRNLQNPAALDGDSGGT